MITDTSAARPAGSGQGQGPLLDIRGLRVDASTRGGDLRLVDRLDLRVERSEVRAIVGESGSGKSTVCLSVLGLLSGNANISAGSITFDGERLDQKSAAEMRKIRGRSIGIVFQDPLSSLDPVRRIGPQLWESRRIHGLGSRKQQRPWAHRTLADLGFTDPKRTARAFPNELSGGMRQRVCVGIAFSTEPKLVIADEPTTSLDVSLQGRLLRLLLDLRERLDTSVILVSHDVAVVKAVADRVTVMFGGQCLEEGTTREVFGTPLSPYTRALLDSVPSMAAADRRRRLATIPLATLAPSPEGCPFAGRCRRELDICRTAPPPVVQASETHLARCFNPEVAP